MDKRLYNLYSILYSHDNWWNNEGEEKNLQAKEALYVFYQELKKYKPDKKYAKSEILQLHLSYFPRLVNFKKALMEKKYMRACNELISLMRYEPFFQGRIYNNVLRVLGDLFEVKKANAKISPANEFDFNFVMDFAVRTTLNEHEKENQLLILDFMLDAVKEDLKADLFREKFADLFDFRVEIFREISKIRYEIGRI